MVAMLEFLVWVAEEQGSECPWCGAWSVLGSLFDPATLACDNVCEACERAYWGAPLVSVGGEARRITDQDAELYVLRSGAEAEEQLNHCSMFCDGEEIDDGEWVEWTAEQAEAFVVTGVRP